MRHIKHVTHLNNMARLGESLGPLKINASDAGFSKIQQAVSENRYIIQLNQMTESNNNEQYYIL